MQVTNLNLNNFLQQITQASAKDKIGWNSQNQQLTLTTGATLKERIMWRKPNSQDRGLIAVTFLNSINAAVKTGQLGDNAKEIHPNHFKKLIKKFSREGVTVQNATKIVHNVLTNRKVYSYHPLKAAGQWIRNVTGFNRASQLRDINEFMKNQLRD